MLKSPEIEINEKIPSIIRAAGKIASQFFTGHAEKKYKEDNTIVTEADEAVQRYLVAEFSKFQIEIPIIAEEEGLDTASLSKSEYAWVIDPIDGTSQYANGLDNWVIAIALLQEQEPCAGWIYQPILDKLYLAPIGDNQAYMEIRGKRTVIPKVDKPKGHDLSKKDIICFGSRTFSQYKLKPNKARIQCLGSLTIHALETVIGHTIAAFSFDNKIWDICAVAEIARRTDVEIRYVSGKEVDYKSILSSKDKSLEDDMIVAHKNIYPIIRSHLTKVGFVGSIKFIETDEELADAACDILEAFDRGETLMITKQARWFKTRLEGNNIYYERQKMLESQIEQLAKKYNPDIYSILKYKIILTENPMSSKSLNVESIKMLMRGGAQIRYLANYDNKYRVLIGNEKVLISYVDSENPNAVVDKGILYRSTSEEASAKEVINLFSKEFYKLYQLAEPLKLTRDNKIVYSKSYYSRMTTRGKRISFKGFFPL